MAQQFNPLDYPACLMQPAWACPSDWTEHVPFLFTLAEMVRPRLAVGLGDPTGVAYLALCQAIDRLGFPCRATGASDGAAEWQAHHDTHYGRFSILTADPRDGVRGRFADGALDLLLLDGRGDPDSVRRDWEYCLPKMSERGVLVLHGVGAADGAGALWDELRARRPAFEFTHGHGLGVLAVGERAAEALGPLLAANDAETTHIRQFYYQIGRQIRQGMEYSRLCEDRQILRSRLAETEQLAQVYRLQGEECDESLRRATAELEPIQRSLALRCVRLLARLEWALAPAGSPLRRVLHLARRKAGAA